MKSQLLSYLKPMLTLLGSVVLSGAALAAPIALTVAGGVYSQNFDGLSNTANSTANALTLPGWAMTETGGGARDNEQYAVNSGASATGDTYSYGSDGSTDRALGGLRSGALIPLFGVNFKNETGATITSLLVAYTGEQWRLGTEVRADRLAFEISLNATDLVSGTWVAFNALDFISPTTSVVGAKDGNSSSNRTTLSATLSGLNITSGSTFWMRWTDIDVLGSDDGLAVDDFTLTAQTNSVPEPDGLALIGAALIGGGLIRRRVR